MKLRRQRTPAYFKLPVQVDPRDTRWPYGEEEPETDETPEEELARLTAKSPNGWERGVNEPSPVRKIDIVKHYVAERQNLTEKTLAKFVRRWRAIWEIQYQLSHLDKPLLAFRMRKENYLLLSGKFSSKKLWKALQYMSFGHAPPKSVYDWAAGELLIPRVLLQTTMVASHFQAPATLAQVRLCVHSFPGYEGWGF